MPQMVLPKSSRGQSDIRARNQALEARGPGQGGSPGEPGLENARHSSPNALEYSKADSELVMVDGAFGFRTKSVMGRLWDEHLRHLGYPPQLYGVQDTISGKNSRF